MIHNFISTLSEFQSIYFEEIESNTWQTSNVDHKEIIKRYSTGVPIKELAKQFDTTINYLRTILLNIIIELIDDNEPTYNRLFKYKKNRN